LRIGWLVGEYAKVRDPRIILEALHAHLGEGVVVRSAQNVA
jgi:hypothetical protein